MYAVCKLNKNLLGLYLPVERQLHSSELQRWPTSADTQQPTVRFHIQYMRTIYTRTTNTREDYYTLYIHNVFATHIYNCRMNSVLGCLIPQQRV